MCWVIQAYRNRYENSCSHNSVSTCNEKMLASCGMYNFNLHPKFESVSVVWHAYFFQWLKLVWVAVLLAPRAHMTRKVKPVNYSAKWCQFLCISHSRSIWHPWTRWQRGMHSGVHPWMVMDGRSYCDIYGHCDRGVCTEVSIHGWSMDGHSNGGMSHDACHEWAQNFSWVTFAPCTLVYTWAHI